ncbi:hypothetical protein MMC31_004912, partial [Peltigera leucophlebia]|nr:hypothetical protein [Peltigera leucophlebia]
FLARAFRDPAPIFSEDLQDSEAEVSSREENPSETAENPSSPTLGPRRSRRKFGGELSVPQIPHSSKNECQCSAKIPPKFLAQFADPTWISVREALEFSHFSTLAGYRFFRLHKEKLGHQLALSKSEHLDYRIKELHQVIRADDELEQFLIDHIEWFQTPIWLTNKREIGKNGVPIIWKHIDRTEDGKPTIEPQSHTSGEESDEGSHNVEDTSEGRAMCVENEESDENLGASDGDESVEQSEQGSDTSSSDNDESAAQPEQEPDHDIQDI